MKTTEARQALPCSLCRAQPAAADAHIYPRALCEDVLDGQDDVLRSIPSDTSEFVKRCRTGPKSKGILCHGCEARFHVYDTWLVEALRAVPRSDPHAVDSDIQYLPGAEAGKLKLGFMHVLWRAHVASQLGVFGNVSLLDTQVNRLRSLLLENNPGWKIDFPVILTRYDEDPDRMHGVLGAPIPFSWKGSCSDGVQLPLSLWRVVVTCTASGIPPPFDDLALIPGRAVQVLRGGDFRTGLLFQSVIDVSRRRAASPPSRADC